MHILRLLLDRPGQFVAREDLIRQLWPEGTFVDYDHSLNASVAKTPSGLLDSADRPRYIETLGRRGYRFIANTEVLAAPGLPPHQRLAAELDIRFGVPRSGNVGGVHILPLGTQSSYSG